MSRMLIALLVTASITAGCASSGTSETTRTIGSASTSATHSSPTKTTKLTAQEKAVKFAECMRANGVSDFPDPNASGEFVYGVSVSPAVFKQAVDACKDLQPPGTLSAKRSPEQQKEGLTFAQCIRENGVRDFPDPVNGEPLVDTRRIPSSATNGGMTILNAAMHKCSDLLAKAAAGQ